MALAQMYPTLSQIGVENVGEGRGFYSLLLRTTRLPIMPRHPAGRSKGQRFQRDMAPMFEYSRAWLSDVDTPFLKTFVDEWVGWDGTDRVHDDTLDAVYWMLDVSQWHLMARPEKSAFPTPFWEKKKSVNPYKSLVRG